MGAKFANFSILQGDVKKTIELLKKMPKPAGSQAMINLLSKAEAENLSREAVDKKQVESMFSQLRDAFGSSIYYVGKNSQWVTVFSETFGVESIEQFAARFSAKSPQLFMTIGDFDDDVFMLSLMCKGKVLTRYVSEPYEMLMVGNLGNTTQTAELLGMPEKKGVLNDILKEKDIKTRIEGLEKLLGMKLWLNSPDRLPVSAWEKIVILNE
jgi:hypothetical protein